ncbi:hypothetical protein ABB37_01649 [Leptomonas pyrrhocoris]|uniref:Uncharacterized protein n=1 Tax=Leptomonas pyrrhocoris TaxID=157538 RepID=A0A0M9G9D9_LEPPY|nr:hypothetical protein ABB37_01649 [Leptomonas pyrrhocoris]KPA85316.1 hypothetical protein ABB37_01649 [Leptomonas pyrrhocoris]|eukprot:XP_015663755.1 hypothetical protein ABB37_01649 [Leptomonas pyrrhocoris]
MELKQQQQQQQQERQRQLQFLLLWEWMELKQQQQLQWLGFFFQRLNHHFHRRGDAQVDGGVQRRCSAQRSSNYQNVLREEGCRRHRNACRWRRRGEERERPLAACRGPCQCGRQRQPPQFCLRHDGWGGAGRFREGCERRPH